MALVQNRYVPEPIFLEVNQMILKTDIEKAEAAQAIGSFA